MNEQSNIKFDGVINIVESPKQNHEMLLTVENIEMLNRSIIESMKRICKTVTKSFDYETLCILVDSLQEQFEQFSTYIVNLISIFKANQEAATSFCLNNSEILVNSQFDILHVDQPNAPPIERERFVDKATPKLKEEFLNFLQVGKEDFYSLLWHIIFFIAKMIIRHFFL